MIEQLSLSISAFLVTYFVHSSIFIITALLAIKFKKITSDKLGEYVLKSALILGILTTTIQKSNVMFAQNIQSSLSFQWQITTKQQPKISSQQTPINTKQENLFSNKTQISKSLTVLESIERPSQTGNSINGFTWITWLILAWLIFSLILLSKKAMQWQHLKLGLKKRTLITNNIVKHIFSMLVQQSRLKRRVIISESSSINSPIALSNSEIVLPKNFHEEYDIEHVKAALAHELAHIKRFDGYWLWLGLLIESIFFIQPLNRLINKQIYQLAELRSDMLAAQWTGDPHALAEALSQVAHKTYNNNSIQMVPAMKSNKSVLRIRIENLIFNKNKKTSSLSIIFITLLCAVVLIAAPGVTINTANAWPFSEKNSRSISLDDDGNSKISISSTKDGKKLKLKATLNGHLEFNNDESKILSFPKDSLFDMTINEGGIKHRILIKSDDSGPSYSYYLNGDVSDFDQTAQNWFASVIPEILRTTGIDAEKRVERISKSRGNASVLDEIELISSDFIKKEYFLYLFKLTDLSEKNLTRVISLSGDIGSDFEQSAVLSSLIKTQKLTGESIWKQALDATTKIGSDFEQAKTLISFIDKLPQSSSINKAYFNAASKIGSDFEMRRVFTQYIKRQPKQSVNLIQMFDAAKSIGSDFELASLLIVSKDQMNQSQELFSAYIDLAETIGSDFELRKVYSNLLSYQVNKDNLNRLIDSAQSSIGSDFELSSLLTLLIDQHDLDAEQVKTIKNAAKSIGSKYERNKVLIALVDKT